ncbi:hypothetical protein L1887_18622 [Cichorium endivia]|nr:hypothetical protein L1887_18622 [Cichorium endivia]
MVLVTRHEYFKDPPNDIDVPSPPAPQPVCLNAAVDISFPFGKIEGLDRDDLRTTAYEIFFTACRSSAGFGGRSGVTSYSLEGGSTGSPVSPVSPRSPQSPRYGIGVATTSKTKKALGLKMLKRTPSTRRSISCGSNPLSPSGHGYYNNQSSISPRASFSTLPTQGKMRRPLTSAEIMRQQMKVTEGSDNRLRKTLMRTLVGQTGRPADTIILPLELLRQLKPAEFNDITEYHTWQKRQLRILEAGILDHPSIPLEKSHTNLATRLREIIRVSDVKPIETNKSSDTMKTVCNCVVSLSWRSPNATPTNVCHWADGYPLNLHLYVPLLRTIFDSKDETCVLDEVDELLELMKKTWPTLGITRPIHNLCLTWVLFERYVLTGQTENDLLSASFTMLTEVANDAKKVDRDPVYVQMLSAMLNSIKTWSEKRLLDYHESFSRGTLRKMENILPLVFTATKILEEDVPAYKVTAIDNLEEASGSKGNNLDRYIRSSLRNAFVKMMENGYAINGAMTVQEISEKLIELADKTEELVVREKEMFSKMLKKWHPLAGGVAAVTLHACYGNLLRQFLVAHSKISNETVAVLQRADKLEKVLINVVIEDSVECEDGGKAVVREMVSYEVDSIVLKFLRQWIQESLKNVRDVVLKAKESETWNPMSKSEPYAQSAMELMKQTKDAVDSFFGIPIGVSEELVREFANAVEQIVQDYTTLVASCGSKQSYVPALPPLSRCGRGSKFTKLWRKATPACSAVSMNTTELGFEEGNFARPSTSRGTQRLYIRLNTLHYILLQLNSIEKNIALSPKIILSPRNRFSGSRRQHSGSYFDQTRYAIQSATQNVSEVAAYRLIFLDSNSLFYGTLYVGVTEISRIAPALRIMKHNLTLLTAIVTDRAQPLAMKEVMRASFDAYLTILLAGGSARNFTRTDFKLIEQDLKELKRVFLKCGEGLIVEDVIDKEAETAEEVVALMGQSTEQLVEEFTTLVCEASGVGMMGSGQKLPMPPTTGKWSATDPNTILRILCHRNEGAANLFLKKTFQLPKRK